MDPTSNLKLNQMKSYSAMTQSNSTGLFKTESSHPKLDNTGEEILQKSEIISETRTAHEERGDDRLKSFYETQSQPAHYRYKKKEVVPVAPPRRATRSFHNLYKIDSSLRPLRMSFSFSYPSLDTQAELLTIANRLVAPGRGILAADESISTMGKRFMDIGVDNCEENRRRYKELLFTVDNSISDYISGVIFFHETLFQKTSSGILFSDYLKDQGLLIGIKVDRGTVPLFCSDGEVTTQGLDDLDARCAQYKRDGCDFAKWRCIFTIGRYTPSPQAINENARVLARFASICQAHGLVPVMQPDVIADGDHNILKAQKVTEKILATVFKALSDQHVFLEGTILVPNMVTPGLQCTKRCTTVEIATATVITLQRSVPSAVSGIAFLSGGQTEEEASMNLDTINKTIGRKPWPMTFSYSRGLQLSVLRVWAGSDDNKNAAQEVFIKRAKILSLASRGWFYKLDKISIHEATTDGLQHHSFDFPL